MEHRSWLHLETFLNIVDLRPLKVSLKSPRHVRFQTIVERCLSPCPPSKDKRRALSSLDRQLFCGLSIILVLFPVRRTTRENNIIAKHCPIIGIDDKTHTENKPRHQPALRREKDSFMRLAC